MQPMSCKNKLLPPARPPRSIRVFLFKTARGASGDAIVRCNMPLRGVWLEQVLSGFREVTELLQQAAAIVDEFLTSTSRPARPTAVTR